jgi:hypothetical protein
MTFHEELLRNISQRASLPRMQITWPWAKFWPSARHVHEDPAQAPSAMSGIRAIDR